MTAYAIPGSEEHTCQITRVTKDTSATTDDALTTGVDCEIVNRDDVQPLYCSEKDKEWLLKQQQNDITTGCVEPWI